MEQRKINKIAKAGSVESNDILVLISPGEGTLEVELESTVYKQFGDNIKKLIIKTLEEEGVIDAKIIANDKGALDFTIIARVKACITRGSGENEL